MTLRNRLLLWSAAGFMLNVYFLSDGITLEIFLYIMLTAWIPYIIVSFTVIRGKFLQQIFVIGIQGLWNFMLHAAAGMITAATFGKVTAELLSFQATMYFVLFAIFFPFAKSFFVNLLTAELLFKEKNLKTAVAFMPPVVLVGNVIPILNVTFFPTWQERFSHILIPIFFFIMYRSMNISARQIAEQNRQEQETHLMRQQVSALLEQNLLIKSSNLEVERLRADLNKSYDVIDALIENGKISAAMQYIKEQDNLLDKTVVKKFCDAPLVNAAISIYFNRARELNIKFYHKINLPAEFSTDENELALLLSNLLENAVNASAKQKINRREISLIVQHNGEQVILEISNRFDKKIKIGKNNLPVAELDGHGLGMMSLESFAKKYDAYVDFSQIAGKVQFSIYWQENFSTLTDEQANAYTLP